MTMKPMLASDWDENKIKFPVIAQPKIDGVRALNMYGALTGRSLRAFDNSFSSYMFSRDLFRGFDGEMAAWEETAPDLCRRTTSALSSHDGEPWLMWHLFDYVWGS